MQSQKEELFLNISQKSILILFLIVTVIFLLIFRNVLFEPTLLLKSFGKSSIDPEIALNNDKPTFLEFYAEWCEVCKETAPKVSALKEEYEKEINFVFLNVDNPKWEKYIRKFNVNGIPQVNLLNKKGNLETTFIGKHEVEVIQASLENLNRGIGSNKEMFNSELSLIKENKKSQASPRSHG